MPTTAAEETARAEIESVPELRPMSEPEPMAPSAPSGAAITQAIEEVNDVIEQLKRSLDQMEEVLEMLELAERQKIDDEREIDALRRSLRRLHRPGQGGSARP